jgi:hypothetical protein
VPEIEKALSELKRLMAYRIKHVKTVDQKEKERNFTGLGLTSRRNLCLHPEAWNFELIELALISSTGFKREERSNR